MEQQELPIEREREWGRGGKVGNGEDRRGEETELRDICDNNKRSSIYVIRILDRREREELKTQRNKG